MEKKIIAAIAVITMVFAAMVPLVEADTGEASYNTVSPELGEEFVLCVNEANYNDNDNGYKASFTWKAKLGEGPDTELKFENGVEAVGDYIIERISGSNGRYVFIINYSGEIQGDLPLISLMWCVSLNVGNVTKSLNPVSFPLRPVQKTSVEPLVLGPIDAVVGELQDKRLKWEINSGETANEETMKKWQWYAIGLPNGLSMSTDGRMIGIPTEETAADGIKAIVTATKYDERGYVCESRTGELEVKVTKDTSPKNFTWSVGGGSDESPVGYIAYVGEAVGLVTKINNDPTVLDSVSVVNNKGEYVSLESGSESGEYTLPTDGTGSYVVVMKYAGYQTQTMKLYVVAKPAEVTTGIIVSHS